MGEVRVIHGRQPDPDLVAALRDLLADAETGKLTALVGVAEYHDDEPSYITAGSTEWWSMSGRLADLARDVVIDDDDA